LNSPFSALFGKRAVVLPIEHHKGFRKPVRYLDGVHDTARCFVISAKIIYLAPEIVFNRARDARIKELRGVVTVEITLVQNRFEFRLSKRKAFL
jgi:hypothetical protein